MMSTHDLLVPEKALPRAGWRSPAYGLLAFAAFAATIGVWLLMVLDDGRTPARATADLFLTFTNLTTLLVGVVATCVASGLVWRWLSLSHLTVTTMAVVTGVVNALLLDPALPGGWWGVVDLFQHYVMPLMLLGLWLTVGPRFAVSWRTLPAVVAVPVAWLAVALVRGTLSDEYPYDFLDAGANGWASVATMVVVLLALLLGLGAAFVAIDRARSRRS